MTKNPILKIENLSKQYRLGVVGTGTLSHDLNRWWYKVRGMEDPYLKIGETNDRATTGSSDYVWALKDINIEVQQGEVLGIIGKNGAGKSTLLKILSRVTSPTTGTVKSRGRIASLLEVGTGFHPELTGRENIYLNGAILGMTKEEINAKFDEIVDFAGVARYIDTPVKRYSSGMTVRLAFAVAAHLEPEILVIDEVLAVGDAEFQKKAIGKMQDISKGEGRTVLFVSHNMAAVKNLCTRAIVLVNGSISFEGGVDEAVDFYINNQEKNNVFTRKYSKNYNQTIFIRDINFLNPENNNELGTILSGQTIFIEIEIENKDYKGNLSVGVGFYDESDQLVIHCSTEVINQTYISNGNKLRPRLVIEKWPLPKGEYYINAYIRDGNLLLDHVVRSKWISVDNGDFYKSGKLPSWKKGVFIDYEWQ